MRCWRRAPTRWTSRSDSTSTMPATLPPRQPLRRPRGCKPSRPPSGCLWRSRCAIPRCSCVTALQVSRSTLGCTTVSCRTRGCSPLASKAAFHRAPGSVASAATRRTALGRHAFCSGSAVARASRRAPTRPRRCSSPLRGGTARRQQDTAPPSAWPRRSAPCAVPPPTSPPPTSPRFRGCKRHAWSNRSCAGRRSACGSRLASARTRARRATSTPRARSACRRRRTSTTTQTDRRARQSGRTSASSRRPCCSWWS
mmetsp:Transcript_40724/g.101141  ORF Transcript_40724/g.101141 Transcript_40724/m.101141 type:complete len:255 (-) Transcript_40724:1167-1931(-)